MPSPCLLWRGCGQVLWGGLCVCVEVDRFKALKQEKEKSMGAVWQGAGHSLSSGPQWFWEGQSGPGWVRRPPLLSLRLLEMKPEGLEAGVPFPALEGDSGLRWRRLRVDSAAVSSQLCWHRHGVLPATLQIPFSYSVPGRVPAPGLAPMTDNTWVNKRQDHFGQTETL